MNDTIVTLPAPELPAPLLGKFEREKAAFYQLLPELLKTYRGQYVAIHEERVIDSDVDDIALLTRVLPKVGKVAIFTELVTEQPRKPIRIPHYRVLYESEDTP